MQSPKDNEPPKVDQQLAAVGRSKFLWQGQALHVLLLLPLVSAAWALADTSQGAWLGLSVRTWFIAALAVPMAHQVIVVVSWRTQLLWQSYTRLFGGRDLLVWRVVFLPFLAIRVFLIIVLGLVDTGTLRLPSLWAYSLGAALLIPTVYGSWSVFR